MNEAEYVVPPSNGAPNVSGSAPKPPKQPNKVVAWVKSNVATTVAGSVMALIVVLFGVAVVTNQKLEFAGISLNPLYQQADCKPEEGCVSMDAFTIQGTFADGTVNVPYTQEFSVPDLPYSSEGGPIGMCTWSTGSDTMRPPFAMEFIVKDGGPGLTATFSATPNAVGTYEITIIVSCSNTGREATVTLPWKVNGPSTDLTIESAFEPATLGEMYFSKLKAVNAGDANCTFSFNGAVPAIGDGVIDTSYRNPDGSIMVDQIKFVGSPQTPGDYNVTIGVECSPKVGDGPTKTATKTFKLKVNDVPGIAPGNTGLDLTANLPDGIVGTKYEGAVNSVNAGADSKYTCRATVKNTSPSISGAYIVNAYPNGELGGKFIATPKTAGTYTVTFHAICFSRDMRYPVPNIIVFDKDFQWVVKTNQIDPPAPVAPLDINATFANATAKVPFSTNVRTVNGFANPLYNCNKLGIVSINPMMTAATITPVLNIVATSETEAVFAVTPQDAGTFKVKLSATCDPKDPLSKITSLYKEKEFTWVVNAATVEPVPISNQLGINATFANAKVGQAYTASVSTVNGASNCNLALVNVNPAIAGAMLDQVSNVGGNPSSSAIAAFRATPTTAGTYTVKISATCPPLVGDGPTRFVEKTFTLVVDAATVTGGGSGGSGSGSGGSGSGGGGSTPSSTTNVCTTYSNKLVPIYRWWNDTIKDHFYTMNANEKPSGYVSEGISAYIFSEKIPGSTALYRSFSAPLTAHYYSTVDDAEKYGYKTEGIMGYVFSASTTGTVPWYRLHKGWPANDYLQTLSTKEKSDAMSKLAYTDAGIAAYLCGSK